MIMCLFHSIFSIFLDNSLREILTICVFSFVKPAKELSQNTTFTEIMSYLKHISETK